MSINPSKLCYALTRRDSEEFVSKEADWLLDKEKYSDNLNFQVGRDANNGELVVSLEGGGPLFKHIPPKTLCVAGILENYFRYKNEQTKELLNLLKNHRIILGSSESNKLFIGIADSSKSLFNISIKLNDDIDPSKSYIEKSFMDLILKVTRLEKAAKLPKLLAKNMKISKKILHESRDLLEEHGHSQLRQNEIQNQPPLLLEGPEPKPEEVENRVEIIEDPVSGVAEKQVVEKPISALEQTIHDNIEGVNSSIETIEQATEELEAESVELVASSEQLEEKHQSLIDKIGQEKLLNFAGLFATRAALHFFQNSLHKDGGKSDEEFVRDGYSSRVEHAYDMMSPQTPMSFLWTQHAAQQAFSPYWDLNGRFQAIRRSLADYQAMEKDLKDRLSARKALLAEARGQKQLLEEHDKMIHDRYHKMINHRDSLLHQFDILNQTIGFLAPLAQGLVPGAGIATRGYNELVNIVYSDHMNMKGRYQRDYRGALAEAEQNHHLLGKAMGSLEQDINQIDRTLMQQRLYLLNAEEMGSPIEYFNHLLETRDNITTDIQSQKKEIAGLEAQIAFNEQMAQNLYTQAAQNNTARNAKKHKGRVQDGIRQQNEADGLRAKNINLKQRLQALKEAQEDNKRLEDEYDNKIKSLNTSKKVSQFLYELVEEELNRQFALDSEYNALRGAAAKGFYNYMFTKRQRTAVANDLFFSSESLIAELTSLAAFCNQKEIANYGQKGQLFLSMGRNLYNFIDLYSTWSAGKKLLDTTLSTLQEKNPGATLLDAISALGPILITSTYIVPGVQLLSLGLTLMRQGAFIISGNTQQDTVFSQLNMMIGHLSKQIHQESTAIHNHLNINHQETKALLETVRDEIEVLHSNITEEINRSREEILCKVDTVATLKEAKKIQSLAEKIQMKVDELSRKIETAQTAEGRSRYLDKLLDFLSSQSRFIHLDGQRGLVEKRSSSGSKEKAAVVSIDQVIQYPEEFSAILGLSTNYSDNVPSLKLFNALVSCFQTLTRNFGQELSEDQSQRAAEIQSNLSAHQEQLQGLIDQLGSYASHVYQDQASIMSHWQESLDAVKPVDHLIEKSLLNAVLEKSEYSLWTSGHRRYGICEWLQNETVHPEFDEWAGGNNIRSISDKSIVLGFTIGIPYFLGSLAVFAATKPSIALGMLCTKTTPSNFLDKATHVKPGNAQRVKILDVKKKEGDDWVVKVNEVAKNQLKQLETEEDDTVYTFRATAMVDFEGKVDLISQGRKGLITAGEAALVDKLKVPDVWSYGKSHRLMSSYGDFLESIKPNGTPIKGENPFVPLAQENRIVVSSDPSLVPLILPKEVLEHCESCLSYEKALLSLGGKGVLVPMYSFEKIGSSYVLKVNYHHFNSVSKEKTDVLSFEILEIDDITVRSFSSPTTSDTKPKIYINECLLQLFYTQNCESAGKLEIPGSETVSFENVDWVVPSERSFPGFFKLLEKKPREKIHFNHRTYTEELSQQLMDYAASDEEMDNPLPTTSIKVSALAKAYKFRRLSKEIIDRLDQDTKKLQDNYKCLHAFFCMATSLSDTAIKSLLEHSLGIVEPLNSEALLHQLHLNKMPLEPKPDLNETADFFAKSFQAKLTSFDFL